MESPLILPEQGAVQVQLSVGEPAEDGHRQLSIHSRPESRDGEPEPWTRHAGGALAPAPAPAPEPLGAWPPEGSEEIELGDFYEDLAEIGFEYGPAFQGLTAAWRRGEEVYAEISLPAPQREEAAAFGIHPALLDAALHSVLASLRQEGAERPLALPFSWGEVSLAARGAAQLRVRLGIEGEAISLRAYDQTGEPLATVGSLRTRQLSSAQLAAASRSQPLLALEWKEVEPPAPAQDAEWALVGEHSPRLREALEAGGLSVASYPDPDALREATRQGRDAPPVALFAPAPGADESPAAAAEATRGALALLQRWLAEESFAVTRLALLTEGAIASRPEESPELSLASLWGLLRSAQSEHPGRFALIDSDGSEASLEALPAAAAQGEEPQLALREGRALAPGWPGRRAPPLGRTSRAPPSTPKRRS